MYEDSWWLYRPCSYYSAMHCSVKHGIAIACRPSVCLSVCPPVTLVDEDHVCWKSCKLIAWTMSLTPSLFIAQRPSTYSQGKFGDTRGGVGKSGVLEHKSGNISETRKDRGKVTMEGLYELTNALSNCIIPSPTASSSPRFGGSQPPP